MKIMMLSDLYPPLVGGVERHVQSLSRQLSERGHKVFVGTIGQRGLAKYEEDNGVMIYRLEGLFQKIPSLYRDRARKGHPPIQDWLISRELARIIEKERPDIIHVHGWMVYSVIPVKKRFKIPLVYTMHGYRLFCPKMTLMKDSSICDDPLTLNCIRCMRYDYGLLRSLLTYAGVKAGRNKLKSVDRFIAVSDFVKNAYDRHLGVRNAKIEMIPNFYAPNVDEGSMKVESLPDDFILFVGQLMPHKGVEVLIKAYQKLDTRTKLLIIGVEHPDFRYESTESVLIIKNAPHPAVMGAMSKCRFLVIPSICAESASTVAREAMSQRKAVIASDIGGQKEAVVDGETGILVPPGDADRLAEALSYLLQRPETASQMGERGYGKFMATYTSDVVIPKIIKLYESLISSV